MQKFRDSRRLLFSTTGYCIVPVGNFGANNVRLIENITYLVILIDVCRSETFAPDMRQYISTIHRYHMLYQYTIVHVTWYCTVLYCTVLYCTDNNDDVSVPSCC